MAVSLPSGPLQASEMPLRLFLGCGLNKMPRNLE